MAAPAPQPSASAPQQLAAAAPRVPVAAPGAGVAAAGGSVPAPTANPMPGRPPQQQAGAAQAAAQPSRVSQGGAVRPVGAPAPAAALSKIPLRPQQLGGETLLPDADMLVIQRYLDENHAIIRAIIDSQGRGNIAAAQQLHRRLQHNLLYLSALAEIEVRPGVQVALQQQQPSQPQAPQVLPQSQPAPPR
jgi:hypothetical protein